MNCNAVINKFKKLTADMILHELIFVLFSIYSAIAEGAIKNNGEVCC